jgi:putative oxidoreductase
MATSIAVRAEPARDYSSALALTGRVLIAAIFVLSGLGKVAQPGPMLAYIGAAGLPYPKMELAGSALVEIVGGTALVLGYRTRLAALVLALFSLLTAFTFHSAFADQNQFIHFFKNVAMAGGLLQVFAFGGGRLSLDSRLNGRASA